jgi:6-pyruvoyltetrahydropterin/6-carboxytetrahydropterin synthase
VYSVTKQIDFCYGHRLLGHDGNCGHPHGHNAVADIELQAPSLNASDMVCDFSDIKRIMKVWIDRELDHKMILHCDDPLLAALRELGEPVFVVDKNPTAEHLARLIFEQAMSENLPVTRVTVWETPTSSASYGRGT